MDLIKKLTDMDPHKRIGFKIGRENIKNHPFFYGVNFDQISKREFGNPVNEFRLTGDGME